MNNNCTRIIIFVLTIAVLLLSVSSCSKIRSSEKLFTEIEKKYNDNWYKDVKFMISATKIMNDSTESRHTYSAEYVYPSQLLVKTDIVANDGFLYRNDSINKFTNGELDTTHYYMNKLVHLIDVYVQNHEKNLANIDKLGIEDASEFCDYEINGRKFYILGISEISQDTSDESIISQIWFDAKTLLPDHAMEQRNGHVYEIQFENFIQIGGTGFIPQKITYKKDGEARIIERIYDIVVPIYEKDSITVDNFCDNETINEKQMNQNTNISVNFMLEP